MKEMFLTIKKYKCLEVLFWGLKFHDTHIVNTFAVSKVLTDGMQSNYIAATLFGTNDPHIINNLKAIVSL